MLIDPRPELAEQSSFIGYLLGLAGLASAVRALAADGHSQADNPREADDFAAEHADAAKLAAALVKLFRDNAATLTPDRLHSAFFDSHPPALERIGRLNSAARTL